MTCVDIRSALPLLKQDLAVRGFLLIICLLSFPDVCSGKSWALSFGGTASYEYIYYPKDRSSETINSPNDLRLIPEIEMTSNEWWRIQADVEFRIGFSEDDRTTVFLREGYLDIFLSQWDFRLGRQTISWGRADTFNPTDQFARFDYWDLIQPREEGIVALKSDYYFSDYTLELVWSPIFEEDIVPYNPRNRWFILPRESTLPGVGQVQLQYLDFDRREPPSDISSSQIGARLDAHQAGWDYAVMYAFSYDRIPTFVERSLLSVDANRKTATIGLTPVFKRIHVFGMDWATTVRRYGIRGELAYTLTDDPDGDDPRIEDPYFRFVGGIDRHVEDLINTWDVYVILQYALDTGDPVVDPFNPDNLTASDWRHFYRQAVLANIDFNFDEFKKISIESFVNIEDGDYLIKAEFSWKPIDGLTLTLGGDIMGGAEDTFFGFYDANDRVRIKCRYDF